MGVYANSRTLACKFVTNILNYCHRKTSSRKRENSFPENQNFRGKREGSEKFSWWWTLSLICFCNFWFCFRRLSSPRKRTYRRTRPDLHRGFRVWRWKVKYDDGISTLWSIQTRWRRRRKKIRLKIRRNATPQNDIQHNDTYNNVSVVMLSTADQNIQTSHAKV